MKSASSKLLFAALIALAAPLGAHAGQAPEFTKTIKREFNITPNGTTSISNRYGKVSVKTWNRDQVKIDVTIVVDAASESAAQRVFDRINISFTNTSSSVKAITTIEPRKSSFFGDWGSGSADFSINYEVFLPATNNLELEHRYGDAYVGAMKGRVTLDLRYANPKIEEVGEGSSMTFSYGTGSLTKARNMTLDIGYANLTIKEGGDLQFNSKYAKVSVDKADRISSATRYDDYKIGAVRELINSGRYDNISVDNADRIQVNGRYTQVKATLVARSLSLNLQYGGASIGLGRDFTEANVVGSYSDFEFNVGKGANFTIEANTSYAGVDYPRAITVTHEIKRGSSLELKGHSGAKPNAAVIKAQLNYGGMKIRER
jgi:hypothetical protein